MKLILATDVVESPKFLNFVEEALAEYPDAHILINGDILNTFPESRSNLMASLVYEVYGDAIVAEMDNFINSNYRKTKDGVFKSILDDMFLPLGECYDKVTKMVVRRYERFFSGIDTILGQQNKLFFVCGDMDWPCRAQCISRTFDSIHCLDYLSMELDGTKFAGLGGAPEHIASIPGLIESSINHMASQEFKRKLNNLFGADVLVTHVAPEESPELMEYIKKSPVSLVICKSPYNFKNGKNIGGDLIVDKIKNVSVVKVNPFANHAHKGVVIEVANGQFYPGLVRTFDWSE